MKKKIISLVFLIGVLVLSSCSTGKVAYRKGNYYDATMQSVQHLRLKPESANALETIKKSYPMALEFNQQKINLLVQSSQPDKFVEVVELYTQLNTLADEITRCPAALAAVRPVVYFHDQLNKAKEFAAKEQYDEGVRLMNTGFIDDARQAYARFERVKHCKPNYLDIDRKILLAEDLGTLKVVVEQVPVNSQSFQVSAKVFYDRMFNYLKRSVERKFVRFYQPTDAEQLKIIPHQVIRMQFNDFIIGNIREREVNEEFTSDSIVVGSYTDANGNKYDVKGVVKAKVTSTEREVVSKGILDVRVIDYASDQIQTDRKFPGEFIWRNDWATFNGDVRAVPPVKLKLVEQKQVMPPLPQEMFLLFSDPIYANASSFLSSYYRRK
jgi:hypothetical protein